jgi:uncharacterized protein YsxB (DUF464 family)
MPSKQMTQDNWKMFTLENPMKVPKLLQPFLDFKKLTGFHNVYDSLLNGGKLYFNDAEDEDEQLGTLTLESINEKLKEFSENYPNRWKRIVNGQYVFG